MDEPALPLDALLDEPEPDEPGVRCGVCGPTPGCSCRAEELTDHDYRPAKTRRIE